MAKIYGQLEKAQLELLSSDPSSSATGMVYYNTSSQQVRVKQSGGWISIGSGAGGSTLMWVEDSLAPVSDIESNNLVYFFRASAQQSLYALLKVPSGYTAGKPVALRLAFYSPDTSGTALIQSVTTLIRMGVDSVSSTTNQRTSTNAAVTLSGSTQNIPQSLILDLSDSSGKINSVSIAPGDYIKVQLTRGTDTATSDVRVPVFGTEVTFI